MKELEHAIKILKRAIKDQPLCNPPNILFCKAEIKEEYDCSKCEWLLNKNAIDSKIQSLETAIKVLEKYKSNAIIGSKELMEFVKVFNHEYSGREWGVSNFKTALTNWISPTKTK